jgi:hypothetical protein
MLMKPVAILVLAIAVAALGLCILLTQCSRKEKFAVLATKPTKSRVGRSLVAADSKQAGLQKND